jgi:hypothetical protein
VGGRAAGVTLPGRYRVLLADGAWVLYCQARADSNGDGQLASVRLEPGLYAGDLPQLLLTLRAGSGLAIDTFEARHVTARER